MPQTRPDISVVIPVKNEAENIEPLLEELDAVLAGLGRAYEMLVVDDGSDDGSWERLEACRGRFEQLRPLRLDRNHGQSTAFWAGLTRARGHVLAMMDGDRQNDPADIPRLLEEIDRGAEVCLSYRATRRDSGFKRFQSRVGNGFRNRMLGSNIRDTGSQLRAFRRECLDGLPPFDGMHRFMGDLFTMQGRSIVQIAANHRPRPAGKTKYGLGNRAWRGLHDVLAMRWLRRRIIRYALKDDDHA